MQLRIRPSDRKNRCTYTGTAPAPSRLEIRAQIREECKFDYEAWRKAERWSSGRNLANRRECPAPRPKPLPRLRGIVWLAHDAIDSAVLVMCLRRMPSDYPAR